MSSDQLSVWSDTLSKQAYSLIVCTELAHMGVCGWYNAEVSRVCLRNDHSVACRGIYVHTCNISNVA